MGHHEFQSIWPRFRLFNVADVLIELKILSPFQSYRYLVRYRYRGNQPRHSGIYINQEDNQHLKPPKCALRPDYFSQRPQT